MAWLLLLLAAVFEIAFALGLKSTEGFTRPLPTALTLAAMVVSLWLVAQALKSIPVGTGYAVWTGLGAAGTAVLGMILLGESREPLRLACLGLILAGVLGLKLAGQGH